MKKTLSKNILFLASWYPSKVHSTLGNFCQRHAQAIATQNNVTAVYLAKDITMSEPYRIEVNEVKGVKEIICYYQKKGIAGSGYIKAFNHVVKNELLEQIHSFDLIHVNVLYRAGLLALQLKKSINLPFIITEHWTGYHNSKKVKFIQKYFSKKVAKEAARIVPVSEHLGEAMKKFGCNAEYTVVPNVVDNDLFTPSLSKSEKFTFIHVSSLVDDHKNITGIISSFSETWPEIDANLLIIGDGEIAPYIKLAQKLNIPEERFTIKGEQTLPEVAAQMAASHCLILFSNYENQPCVIPEAYSAGIPVIATDVGGIKEHLTPAHGVLITKGNTHELTEAMKHVYGNIKEYDAHWLNAYSREYFSVSAVAEAYSKIYAEVI